jgi:hypothetical protein
MPKIKFLCGILLVYSWLFLFTGCKTGNQSDKLLPSDMVDNPISADNKGDISDLPVMTFEKAEHDFGKIKNGDVVSYGFKFQNTGKKDLIIAKVSTSCGCTASDFTKDPVKPGANGIVTLTFKSEGRTGLQQKMATVMSNTQPNSTVLKIKAFVE